MRKEEIGRAIARVQSSAGGTGEEPAGVLVLTDMFGGTPANLAVTFVSPQVEVITGVEPADADQAGADGQAGRPADAGARDARARPQRHLGRLGPAAGRAAVTSCAVTIVNPLGLHARAAAKFVHAASGFSARIRVARGEREMDGKSIMGLLLLAAAQGIGHHDLGQRRRRGAGARGAVRARRARIRRGGAMRMTGLGVSPGIGVGKALVLKRGTRDLRFRVPAWLVERELDRLDTARARAREQIEQIKARIAATAGAEHAYLFDAQLLMLDDAMLVGRAADTIRTERLNAESALQRALERHLGASSTRRTTRICASARATSPTSSAA